MEAGGITSKGVREDAGPKVQEVTHSLLRQTLPESSALRAGSCQRDGESSAQTEHLLFEVQSLVG